MRFQRTEMPLPTLKSPEVNSIYSQEDLLTLDRSRIPKHVAIIPDGNRRWAKSNGFTIMRGHREGADNLIQIVKAAKELGIKVITYYIFSTENWNRNAAEVKTLLWLLESYLIEQRPAMLENGLKLSSIGDTSRFPKRVQDTLQETKAITAHCNDIEMIMALNYGSRDEIRRAVVGILDDYSNQTISREEVTETLISRYLDTSQWPDPDLLIRTSGEMRVSNFLLWQASYTEFYMTQLRWPEFTSRSLLEAVLHFQHRERRLGGG